MWSVWVVCVAVFVVVRLYARFGAAKSVAAQNKAVFVTGAASGIGRATARRLMRMGCHVYAADLRSAAVDAALRDVGPNYTPLQCNVTQPHEVAQVATTLQTDLQQQQQQQQQRVLWGIVNCAGISHAAADLQHPYRVRSGLELDAATSYLPVLDVNLLGCVRVNQALFPLLMAHGQGGCIINIASVAGLLGLPGLAPYSASKFALIGYTDAVRREVAPYGIQVSALCPGFVQTPMVASMAQTAAADAPPFDYSHTLLTRGRGDEALTRSLLDATLTTPERVAADITALLFTSPPPPRRISDLWFKVCTWTLLTHLPVRIQDAVFRWVETAYGGPSR